LVSEDEQMPVTLPEDYAGTNEFGSNWRVQFADVDGIPLNMVSFEVIDFGAISYKEIFQNVKTILATPLFSAALERTLGIDQTIVDLPIDRAAEATIAILDALTFWEPRVEVMNIDFEPDVLSAHLIVNLQLKIKNVIYGTNKPYEAINIFADMPEKVKQGLPPMNIPVAGPPGPAGPTGLTGQRGSLWYQGTADPPVTGLTPDPLPNDMYLNTTSGDVFQFNGALWAFQLNVKKAMKP
jgi:phage baseplate assembly protein W